MKEMNFDAEAAGIKRRMQISELEELRLKAYNSATIYKERMKRWYDNRLQNKELKKETTSYSTIQGSNSLAKKNCKENGKDHMSYTRFDLREW